MEPLYQGEGLNDLAGQGGRDATSRESTPRHTSTERVRELRANQNKVENVLWQKVRGKQLGGLKFRRQQPIGPYIVDFFCPTARLVIELDGVTHETKEEQDATRQRWLESQGLRVIRFANAEVSRNLQGVLETILLEVERSSSSVS